jgi:hypothetical protein
MHVRADTHEHAPQQPQWHNEIEGRTHGGLAWSDGWAPCMHAHLATCCSAAWGCPSQEDGDGDEDDEEGLEARRSGGAKASGRRPVWNDPEDARLRIDIASNARLRKLRKSEKQKVVNGERERPLRNTPHVPLPLRLLSSEATCSLPTSSKVSIDEPR